MSKFRKMVDPADRARQFMPFAALRGYEDLVRQKERIVQPKRELTEEEAYEVSQTLLSLGRGDVAVVTHYQGGAYVRTTGAVSQVDCAHRVMRVVKERISFDDILKIEPVGQGE